MTIAFLGDSITCGYALDDGSKTLAAINLTGTSRQTVEATFTADYAADATPDDGPDNADILIYRQPTDAAFTDPTIIHWIKLEKGNRATDYYAAPEDAEEALELKLVSVWAQISTEADGIRSEGQANYALASDMSQVRTQVGTLA